MKKLICLLLVLMLCAGAACAETVTVGGFVLNIPTQWRVDENIQAVDGQYLSLSYPTDTPVHHISLSHAKIENWDSHASTEDGLKQFASLSATVLVSKLGLIDAQPQTETHIPLRDGGHALKLIYKDDTTTGLLIILFAGEMVTVLAADEDGAQCEAWLDQMLLPLRVQENIEAGSMYISLPAGFVKNDENGLYINENNEAIKVFTMDATGEDMQKLLAEGPAGLLLLVLKSQIGDLQYSNLQVDTLEYEGFSALISSMDITADGNSGCMGTLTALYDDMIVGVSYLGNQGGQKAAADLMQVITYRLQGHRGFNMGNVPLAYPEGFNMAEYEEQEDMISATLSDQLLPGITVISTPLTEEEKQMDARELLVMKLQEELSSTTGNEVKRNEEEYDGATAIHITWYKEWAGVQYANGLAFAVTEENLIRIYLEWPNGDTEYVSNVLAAMLPAPAGGETVTQGNVTLNIPKDWQLQQSVQENGEILYEASGAEGVLAAYYQDVPDDLRGMIDSMGVQTALEIYLSIWANEAGVEGITIDYAQREDGVHIVTSTFVYQQYVEGTACLLDGDALWHIVIETDTGEEAARALLDSVLEQVR